MSEWIYSRQGLSATVTIETVPCLVKGWVCNADLTGNPILRDGANDVFTLPQAVIGDSANYDATRFVTNLILVDDGSGSVTILYKLMEEAHG